MAYLSTSPTLLKGAILAVSRPYPIPKIVPFQYNPATLTRSLSSAQADGGAASQAGSAAGQQASPAAVSGAPKETLKAEIILDATDDLETDEGLAAELGIYPRISMLETLMYASSETVLVRQAQSLLGVTDISPAQTPFTIFVWGYKRVLPVAVKGMSITEEAFDPQLNPIRAKASLDMAVLTYDDFKGSGAADVIGKGLYFANHLFRETTSRIGEGQAIADIGVAISDVI